MIKHRKPIFSAITYLLTLIVLVSCKTTSSNAAFNPSINTIPPPKSATRRGNPQLAQTTTPEEECPEVKEEAAIFLAPLAGSLLNAAAGAGASFLLNYVNKKLKLPPSQQVSLGRTNNTQQPTTPDTAPQDNPPVDANCDKNLRVDYSPDDGLPAGLAYEVYQLDTEGNEEPVDPNSKVFKTGERIFLQFTANLPGLIDVFNIDSQGDVKKIAEWKVSGGDQVRLPETGAIEFHKTTGDEKLSLYYYPCNLKISEAMRLTKDAQTGQGISNNTPSFQGGDAQTGQDDQSGSSIQSDPNAVALLSNCSAIKRMAYQEKTEAMRVVADGDTNFGVSKLNLKQSSGKPLVIEIGFQHE